MVGNPFRRGPRIGRPQTANTNTNVDYPHAPIRVQPAAHSSQGDVIQTTLRILDEINATNAGRDLFAALRDAGKQIAVRYGGPNNNSARGGVGGYVLLRKHHQAGNNAEFATELRDTMTRKYGDADPANLANDLYTQVIPNWNNGGLRPFALPRQRAPLAPQVGGIPPAPPMPREVIAEQVQAWLDGTELPNIDEADALMLALDGHHTPGRGVVTVIYFDPHKEVVRGQSRPPHCGLYHELVHAYHNSAGTQLGREDSSREGAGGRLFEAMAVGFGLFADRPLHENRFRREIGVPRRLAY